MSPRLRTILAWAGAVVGIILVVSLVANSCQSTQKVVKAQAEAAKADSLRTNAEAHLAVALSALAANKAVVRTIRKEDTVFAERVKVVLAKPVPNACISFTAERDSLISDCQKQTAKWRGAWETLSAVTDSLKDSVITPLQKSNDALKRSVALLTPHQYDLLGRLFHPSIKPSLFGGLCTTGRPCAGVGVAITF